MKGPLLIFFPLKGSALRKIPSFLSLHHPWTSHKHYLCILSMFTMFRKDVNWSSLEALTLRVWKCETRLEGTIKP